MYLHLWVYRNEGSAECKSLKHFTNPLVFSLNLSIAFLPQQDKIYHSSNNQNNTGWLLVYYYHSYRCHDSHITKAASAAVVLYMVVSYMLMIVIIYNCNFLLFRSWLLLFLHAHFYVYSQSMTDMRNNFNQLTLMSCLRKKS